MRKLLISASLLTIITYQSITFAASQVDNETLTFTEISNGVKWKKIVYDNLFGSKEIIHIVEIDLNKSKIQPIKANGCQRTSKMGRSAKALLAINGTFHDKNCNSRNLFKINDTLFSKNIIRKAGSAALIINNANYVDIRMIRADENPADAVHAIGGFPLLIFNNNLQITPTENTGFFLNRYPRTAVGIINEKQIVFVSVEGGSKQSQGFTMYELATYLKEYGVKSAMNLDGGISTTLWVKSEGVVNQPSSKWGEKAIADALAIF